ncbi:MAG: glycosyltransferase family 2 protein [bacterium]
MNKSITVVICTYNRAQLLKMALLSLVDQTLDKSDFDVIVVDNNSTDDTKEISKSFENKLNLRYVVEKNQGLSYARNKGIEECQTNYISFLDDDAKANNDWLEIAYRTIKKKRPEIFGGPIYPFYITKKPKWFRDEYEIRKPLKKSSYIDTKKKFLSGSNIFINQNVFEKIGRFDLNLGMKGNNEISVGEETKLQLIAYKNGIKRYFSKKLIVYHLVTEEKMKVKYIIKRFIATSFNSRFIYPERNNKLFSSFIHIIIGFVLFIVGLIMFPFRNRRKYPYRQNYFLKIVRRLIIAYGKIKSYLKSQKHVR